ncbi:H-NS histone family protein [Paraburkholderia bannensis]|uniref:H-NS histone family protein n=1 Tax=Paraburkholderia bannensis TaxID=765414 RepID=UPI002AB7AC5D|nr:H-NS histone family protein [Paraburkholderia bannensis]
MATYAELRQQLAELEEQAALARANEAADVLADIKAKVEEFGFSEEDIFGRRPGARRRGAPAGHHVTPKYQDPKTGATWTGRGRAPRWIADAKNRDRFLIRKA